MHNVFTYGSLMFSPVWQQVVDGDYRHQSATLSGFKRTRVQSEEYPVIFANTHEHVTGQLYAGVSDYDLSKLDEFEGEFYVRQALEVLAATGENVTCFVYVLSPIHLSIIDDKPWDPIEFETIGMPRFIARYKGFF